MSGAWGLSMEELLGWMAAALTLSSFCCRDVLYLRLLALGANASFIAYALLAGIQPVLALHLLLAPVNIWRLFELREGTHRPPT